MPKRVKLCAIAMNEGPYLADWVFHHLHFGFDAVEVWVNGTRDPSLRILERLGAVDDRVQCRDADDLLEDSVRRGKYFQYRAYARLARKAAREGYTHVAFLDLDEYWMPRDFATGIHDFVPSGAEINVVSFPWYLDVPDLARPAFGHPLAGPLQIQPDPHVKSVVHLDGRATQFRPHTARTTGGSRLLVRDPFPLEDERGQQWGSFVPLDHPTLVFDELPEAFVLHAIHRSETEYVGSLTKVIRRSPTDSTYRTNRRGFLPRRGPTRSLVLEPPGLADYLDALARYRAEAGVDDLVREAELDVRRRAESVLETATVDRGVMERLRAALRGLSMPELDRCYPGWDHQLEWHVDAVRRAEDGSSRISGWAFSLDAGDLEFAFRDAEGCEWPADTVVRTPRPDVAAAHPGAPVDCGFEARCPADAAGGLSASSLLVRPAGSSVWSVAPLPETDRLS